MSPQAPVASVLLVQMPFAAVERPSIGLGLLQASLARAQVSSRVCYPNLDFAALVGLPRYRLVELTRNDDLLGEWVFSPAAFPGQACQDLDYLERVDLTSAVRRLGSRQELLAAWREMREQASAFVDRVARGLLAERPRVVGCSSMFQQHCASLAVLRRIRELDPQVVTLLGGANCEGVMGRASFEAFEWVDYVVCGEAEGLIVELVQDILGQRAVRLPVGVWGPAQRGQQLTDQVRPPTVVLDDTPVPDFHDYFRTLQTSPLQAAVTPGLLIETSRGCWWGQKHHCTFCGLNGQGMAFRSKSATRIEAELAELSGRYQVSQFELTDNILAMERFRDLLPRLAGEPPAYTMFAEVKANLKREQVQALARAGVAWIQPGIESLDDGVLQLMNKGTTCLSNLQLLKWAREFGIFVSWNFLYGFPGEEDSWYARMAEWLPALVHLQPPQGVFRARYDRYSPYQVRPQEYGLEVRFHPAYQAVYPVAPRLLEDLAYFHLDADTARDWGSHSWAPASLGPGHAALERAAEQWSTAFWTSLPPLLCMTDDSETLRLLDTRPLARLRRQELTGRAREVYLACDQGASLRSLGEEARPVLEALCRDHLVLALGDRYLSLAVRGELPGLLRPEQFPGGACRVSPATHQFAVEGSRS